MTAFEIQLELMLNENSYMPNDYNGTIFHYTSPNGFQSILFEKESDICLWASRYDCLNDTSEGKIAEEILKEACKDLLDDGTITEKFFELVTKVKTTKTKLMSYISENNLPRVIRAEVDRYVCSFSKNSDDLSMWNYYSKGQRYEGFNIGFSSCAIKGYLKKFFERKRVEIKLYPVIYEVCEQKKLVKKYISLLKKYYKEGMEPQIRCCVSNQLFDWGLIFKKSFFMHEEEVRIIIDIAKDEKSISIKYRNSAGYIIPYIDLKIQKELLTNVNFGPLQTRQKDNQEAIMREFLIKNGYNNANVGCSKIPIRY